MAARQEHNKREGSKQYRSKTVVIEGRFDPDDTSGTTAPANVETGPGVTSIVHTAVGLHTITLDRAYKKLVNAQASLQMHATGTLFAEIGDETVATTGTIVIRTKDSNAMTPGALADVPKLQTSAGNRIHFRLVLSDTDIPNA